MKFGRSKFGPEGSIEWKWIQNEAIKGVKISDKAKRDRAIKDSIAKRTKERELAEEAEKVQKAEKEQREKDSKKLSANKPPVIEIEPEAQPVRSEKEPEVEAR